MGEIPEDVFKAALPVARDVFNAYHDDDGSLGLGNPTHIVARAILAERERCAAIADAYADTQNKTVLASAVARAIRKGSPA